MVAPKESKADECVKVVVRCRPMSQMEIDQGHTQIVEVDSRRGTLNLKNLKDESDNKSFTFDSVYGVDSKQKDLYDETFRSLVDSVLEGFNGTIFAYGQTGTGKTFTMEGVRSDPEKRGVIPNSFEHIFEHISGSANEQYLVRASYLEIYQEEIRDLLNKDQKKRLELKERPDIGVYVKDLSSFVTKSVEEIEHVMSVGNANRKVGSTNMNEHSSRSHALFMVTVECAGVGPDGQPHIRVGRLNLVDLAGSERQSKTGATGERFKEATKINLSLSALGNVISALVDGKSTHIPYRDSKLTRLLMDSLGGNAKTVMVANIGPASYNFEESLGTLRYANRAKNIKNKPKINEDPKDALLREFQEEIAKLKAMLDAKGGGGGGGGASGKKRKKRRAPRVGESGEILPDEDSEGSDGAENEDEWMAEQEARLEEERQAILHNANIIAGEKSQLLSGIEERAAELESRREATRAMAAKISAMESKLLSGTSGGGNIAAHTQSQQAELERQRRELGEQRRREREVLQELEAQEESTLEIHSTFSSLHQEVEVKTKKLKKMFLKLQQIKAEMKDLNVEHSAERRELEETIMELTKELKLKVNIIENFVPPETRERILARAYFDEDNDAWKLAPAYGPRPASSLSNSQAAAEEEVIPSRPVAAPGRRRPQCEAARMAETMARSQEAVIRYRDENVLLLDLYQPPRYTKDYKGPDMAPGLSEALEEAMLEEEREKTIDISANSHRRYTKTSLPKNGSGATPTAASRHRQTRNNRLTRN